MILGTAWLHFLLLKEPLFGARCLSTVCHPSLFSHHLAYLAAPPHWGAPCTGLQSFVTFCLSLLPLVPLGPSHLLRAQSPLPAWLALTPCLTHVPGVGDKGGYQCPNCDMGAFPASSKILCFIKYLPCGLNKAAEAGVHAEA